MNPGETLTALAHARSVLGAVRQTLEAVDKPGLLLSTKLAAAQVTISEVLDEMTQGICRANAAAVGKQRGRWDPQ